MATVSISFYGLKAKKDDAQVKALLAEVNQWTPVQVDEFLARSDIGILRVKTVKEAVDLIQKFHSVGIVGGIGGLGNPGYYGKQFEKFHENEGRFKITWNFAAAIFPGLWLLCNGLWGKIAIYLMATWVLRTIVPDVWGILAWPLAIVYFGLFGNYDEYLQKVKGEPFWPKVSYQKFKTPFWILFIVYLNCVFVYPGIYLATHMNRTITSFATEGLVFQSVPGNWKVIENPPAAFRFPLRISHPTGQHNSRGRPLNERLSYRALPGTRLEGVIQKGNPGADQNNEKLGLMALIIKKPGLFQEFKSVRSPAAEKMASDLIRGPSLPFFLKWLDSKVPRSTIETSYEKIAGQEWGKLAGVRGMKRMNAEMRFNITVYWTVIDGKAVMLLTESFSPFKDEVDGQAKRFLGSLKTK